MMRNPRTPNIEPKMMASFTAWDVDSSLEVVLVGDDELVEFAGEATMVSAL